MKTFFQRSAITTVICFLLFGSAVGVAPAYAATLTVLNANDNGAGSLRQAILDAAPTDTITFNSSLDGATIHLASTITLSQDVTIDGSTLTVPITISGDNSVQVFSVNSGTVTLNSLTITHGSISDITGGGGIYNQSGATLTINNSTLSGNANTGGPGGGIRNDGTLTVTNSTLSNNVANGPGGGIRNDGTLTVTNSTFSDNSAGLSGGGIRNVGTLTVTNSTFSNNSASGSGGGIYNVAGFTSATVTNSTFSGNSAGSAGAAFTIALARSTTPIPSSPIPPQVATALATAPLGRIRITWWKMAVAQAAAPIF